jgi:hypothetical protein
VDTETKDVIAVVMLVLAGIGLFFGFIWLAIHWPWIWIFPGMALLGGIIWAVFHVWGRYRQEGGWNW